MRKTTKFLLLALAISLVMAGLSFAWEREQMSIHETTTSTVKNSAGTTVINTETGAASLTVTGHSSLDLPLTGGNMTGPIKQRSGAAAVFPNLSGTRFYGAVTGDVTGNVTGYSSLDLRLTGGNMTGAIKQRSGTASTFPNLSTPGGAYVTGTVSSASVTTAGKKFVPYSSTTQGTETPGKPWILRIE